jgi:hypothetical protein
MPDDGGCGTMAVQIHDVRLLGIGSNAGVN